MTTRTTEERHRLSVIRILFERIQETSSEKIPVSQIAHETGISPSNLNKWLKGEAVPRPSSFKIAEQALLMSLNSRLPEQTVHHAQAELQPRSEVLQPTDMPKAEYRRSENQSLRSKFNLETTAVAFVTGFALGLITAAVTISVML